MSVLHVAAGARGSIAAVLSGSENGILLDGPAFCGGPAIVGVAPERVIEGSWGDWSELEKVWTAGRADARGDGGVAGWIGYDGCFRFGLFPRWSRCHVSYEQTAHLPRASFRPGLRGEEWVALVRRAHEYIAAGDIYQVNLTHTLTSPWVAPAGEFYPRFRGTDPPPCSAFLSLGDTAVLSASPEIFLEIDGRRVGTRPIKGTRPRGTDKASDAALARELVASAKERAELVMITDLLRNDLGQVCEYGSVHVPSLCRLETFAHVHHLVSTVEGQLRAGITPFGILRACYPGGSITGAPKKRAREIIGELEPARRGIYTGAIGFVDWAGRAVFSVAIRTLVIRGGHAAYGVGAGIVADSDPRREYAETLQKAAGLFTALGSENRGDWI